MRKKETNIIAITSDVDWAHDDVIKYMLSILDEYNIKITFFCTHEIKIKEMNKHELAIHPNFTKDKTDRETIQELMSLYPEAKGTRSHCLYRHSRLLEIYQEFGLEYESNYILPNQIIKPFFLPNNVLELPIFFSDDFHFLESTDFNLNRLDLEREGLKIFNFHPIHVFLNTEQINTYENAKKYLHEPKKLIKYRNASKKGTCDLFRELCDYIKANNIHSYMLQEVNEIWRGYHMMNRNIDKTVQK